MAELDPLDRLRSLLPRHEVADLAGADDFTFAFHALGYLADNEVLLPTDLAVELAREFTSNGTPLDRDYRQRLAKVSPAAGARTPRRFGYAFDRAETVRVMALLRAAVDPVMSERARALADDDERAGEWGMSLSHVLWLADEHDVELPVEALRVVDRWLSDPDGTGFISPGEPLSPLITSVAVRLARHGGPGATD